jgi:hypothetical protein
MVLMLDPDAEVARRYVELCKAAAQAPVAADG